ncbi:MAG TPA: hypothetical protein DEA78_24740 [Cyanobacteria bacterium UBA11159]|nr:hypothetical protein [Cyanobacteria bacterium UBA11166]HBR76802.1 hypothetical protein [Cyanobacteria bacterium UBA11159]
MTRQTQLIEVIDAVDNLDTITALGSHIQEMAYHLDGSEGEFGAFLLVLEVFLKQLNETTKTIKGNLSEIESGEAK